VTSVAHQRCSALWEHCREPRLEGGVLAATRTRNPLPTSCRLGAIPVTEYANPDRLVTVDELDERRGDDDVAVLEVDVDTTLYEKGHVPEAVGWSWTEDLNHPVRRDILSAEGFETLARQAGIDDDTTVLLYGDNHNWFAAFALWVFEVYGHDDVALVDGGRDAITRSHIELTTETPEPAEGSFTVTETREKLRATRDEVLAAVDEGRSNFIDVRSSEEFSGELVAPPDLDETAQRGGHIPGPRTSRGPRPSTAMARSGPARSSSSSTVPCSTRRARSPTAGSASARPTRGSSSATCSATTRRATTTAAGPSTGTSSESLWRPGSEGLR